MKLTKKQLINEIKTLKKAAQIHTKYSIKQYKKVLHTLDELEAEKASLEQKVVQRTKKLEQIAKYDTLTNLPNRYLFKEDLALTLQSANLMHKNFTLMFLDLDGFKDVNDIYGHEMGDTLLKIVAQRLLGCVRENTDVVARLGGDEFTIILKGLQEKKIVETIANKILEELSSTIHLNDSIKVNISASIGIEIYHHSSKYSMEEILSYADIAMYHAKSLGKNRFVFFDTDMKSELAKKITLKEELKIAYENDEFIYYLQPIVKASTQKICGAEVLLRWKHKQRVVSPAYFMNELEDMDFFVELTYKQIERVVDIFQDISYDLCLSFNLTARMIDNYEIIGFLAKLKKGLNPHLKLYFEITESDFVHNIKTAKGVLTKIAELGFQISLDDFGTGYSSLSHIRDFPLNVIKIDKIFVDTIVDSPKDYKLFKSIITMARILDMEVVIEGVETEDQLQKIRKKSYIKIQGYYFFKPMSIEDFLRVNKDSFYKI